MIRTRTQPSEQEVQLTPRGTSTTEEALKPPTSAPLNHLRLHTVSIPPTQTKQHTILPPTQAMCIVDCIHHATCNHTTYELLRSCSRPKTPNQLAEFELCAQPTYRPPISSREFSCVECVKTKPRTMKAAGAAVRKENVKTDGVEVGGLKAKAKAVGTVIRSETEERR